FAVDLSQLKQIEGLSDHQQAGHGGEGYAQLPANKNSCHGHHYQQQISQTAIYTATGVDHSDQSEHIDNQRANYAVEGIDELVGMGEDQSKQAEAQVGHDCP